MPGGEGLEGESCLLGLYPSYIDPSHCVQPQGLFKLSPSSSKELQWRGPFHPDSAGAFTPVPLDHLVICGIPIRPWALYKELANEAFLDCAKIVPLAWLRW